jgi:hypothetical protein
MLQESFQDAKGVIRNYKGRMTKRTNNDLQNITQKTKEQHEPR